MRVSDQVVGKLSTVKCFLLVRLRAPLQRVRACAGTQVSAEKQAKSTTQTAQKYYTKLVFG